MTIKLLQYLINPMPLSTMDNTTEYTITAPIPGYEFDLYVPAYTMLQFFFYMGWLKGIFAILSYDTYVEF